MGTWFERPFRAGGRHFEMRTEPEITFVTFHGDGHVVVHGNSPEADELVKRLVTAGYMEISTGVPLVRSFTWTSDQPAPDPGALVHGQ